MTKGKYAAKAANRLAELDNELLQQKCSEVLQLRATLDQVRKELADERRDRGSMVLKRAEELAADQVSMARNQLAVVEDSRKDTLLMIANYLVKWFRQDSPGRGETTYPNWFINELLPILIDDVNHRSAFLNDIIIDRIDEVKA